MMISYPYRRVACEQSTAGVANVYVLVQMLNSVHVPINISLRPDDRLFDFLDFLKKTNKKNNASSQDTVRNILKNSTL